jgi:CARDB
LPTAGRTLLTFYDWHINESDDSVHIDVREAGTSAWTTVFTSGRSALPDVSGPSLATEPLTERKLDLAAWKGKTIELRFRFAAGASNRSGSTPFGWYVDDIQLTTEDWKQIAETAGTSHTVTKTTAGTFFYRVAALYTQIALGPWSNVASATADPGPDLAVNGTEITFSRTSINRGQKVTVTAIVRNVGAKSASNVVVRFADNGAAFANVTVASIPAGGSATVRATWKPSTAGAHTVSVTADPANAIDEISETNNSGSRTVTVGR